MYSTIAHVVHMTTYTLVSVSGSDTYTAYVVYTVYITGNFQQEIFKQVLFENKIFFHKMMLLKYFKQIQSFQQQMIHSQLHAMSLSSIEAANFLC